MRIGRLSRRTGISISRIRFYEKHAVLPKPIRIQQRKCLVLSMMHND